MFSQKYAEVRDELHRIVLFHKSQCYAFKHPSGVIEVSCTPANAEDETTDHSVHIGIWGGRHSLDMTTRDLSAAAALIASMMCMEGVEAD